MRKNRIYVILIVIFIVQVSSGYFIQFTTRDSSHSINTQNSHDIKNENIETKIEENLCSSENPGNFTLSTDKNTVYIGFNFTLSWTVSEGADNYSIYMSTKNITIIDGNSTLIKGNLTKLDQSLIASTIGIKYYVVVAYNETGNTLSNSVKINILVLETGEGERELWKAGLGIIDILNPYLLIIIIIIFSIIGIVQARYVKTHRFRAEYKQFLDKEKPLSEKINSNVKIKSAQELMKKIIDNKTLLDSILNEKELEKYELDSITVDFLHKVDLFEWDDESQKTGFISEMLALTPEERDDIINYMIEKSDKNNIFI